MSKLIPIVLFGLFVTLTPRLVAAQDGGVEVLTNDKVVSMVQAGLPPSIIISKIRASRTSFNITTEELIRLQQARVPPDIITAMVEASNNVATGKAALGAGDTTRTDPNDPMSVHDAGIYLLEETDGVKKMTQLEPSVSKQTKTGGVFASAMTGGLAKVKFKAALAGASAPLQISDGQPVFYFYFEVKNAGLSSNSYYATSPNEFVLVKFDTKSNTREVTVSQANAFGAQSGTMDKAARAMKVEKLGPGVYRVTPQERLTQGEYGFYNGAGVGPSGGAKIFDFGIKLPH